MATISDPHPLSLDYGDDWPDAPLPIWRQLSLTAARFPDKLALVCRHQPPGLHGIQSLPAKDLRWTYGQLLTAVDLLCIALQRHGISEGMSLVTFLSNGAEFPLAFWAAHKLRCPFIPLDPKNLINPDEAEHLVSIAQVALVVMDDPQAAAWFDSLHVPSDCPILKVIAGKTCPIGWISFAELLAASEEVTKTAMPSRPQAVFKANTGVTVNPVTVLFTSGTTSFPKGCPHTDLTLNAFMKNLALGGASTEDVFCSVLPNNHAMGYFYVLHFFCNGGTVIYPSAWFDAAEMAHALLVDSVSHTCLVPTALHSLLEHCRQDSAALFPQLIDVCLAGASVTPDHMRQVIYTLGSKGVSTGFGMTEGSPVWAAPVTDPEKLVVGGTTVCGQASPGARIRICDPESGEVVLRGLPGEIQQSGPGLIDGYIGGDGGDSFFTDVHGRRWFRSGDQAVMHLNGTVSIVGRYKDMIIRGGENIAPAAIERVLNQTEGIEAQVVAIDDEIAGELPVAIVRSLPGPDAKQSLQDAVRTTMGPLYVPDMVLTLQDLGLHELPRTMSGKVQKSMLRSAVAAYKAYRGVPLDRIHSIMLKDAPSGPHLVQESVLKIWRTTGIAPAALNVQLPLTNFADSITIMRVRDMYRKRFGQTLSVQEMMQHTTLQAQIQALSAKLSGAALTEEATPMIWEGPPSLEEMQIIVGPENSAARMKDVATAELASTGLDWNRDVRTIIQTSDFTNVMLGSGLMDTWNFAIAITTEGCSVEALKRALTTVLKNNPLWLSCYTLGDADKAPFYVALKPTTQLFDQSLINKGKLSNLLELQQTAITYPHREHSTAPGPLFHALLYYIEESQSAAFVMYLHHILHDASNMRLVLEDLNQALRNPNQPLRPHVSFEVWADMYTALRCSPRASLDVDWHVKRLSQIHLHRKALYPAARIARQYITESPDGLEYGFDAPALLQLKQRHPHITASVVLKAAMALVNITRTNHTHALFSNFEAARSSFPFWPGTLRNLAGGHSGSAPIGELDASDVAGPTMSAVTNLIEIRREEHTINFLNRLQAEQAELTKRAHAPWLRIIEKLNALHPGKAAGEMLHQTHGTQFLSWVPGFLGDYDNVKVAQLAIRCAIGVLLVAGLGGPQATTYMIVLRWDVANYSRAQTQAFVEDVEKAVHWLLNKTNWDMPVNEFLSLYQACK
ncbi:hypothetical protein BAUCODRAFT_123657 [Baudoinia panamericana UAMH 10762]|uniref:Carrier domain-containing protein n=1 Tax=Baudoinia panamericana (strain UAMH 10762) TaxID=717646 RepID=M2N7X8_BAUPA|nr:uncharacterized protein BAUCODRAFT_123657 [Baudoinia panamericana UAMH 10762]EMC95189.1 hypothetical protein BAUCODRAFT_123657 [Baudoinia panamericana UAMH 10762]